MDNDNEEVTNNRIIDKILGTKASYKLPVKYQRFVDEYLIDLNPGRAYKAAGYKISDKAAYQAGWQLLQRKEIQRAVQQQMEERSRRCHIDQDRVLDELAKIGFANIKNVVSWNKWGVTVKDSEVITDEDAAAISEVSATFNEYGCNVKVRMYDKRAALVDIGNHLGIFEKGKDGPKDPIE
ncbi:MAG: terminase small subunit, partial [Candidatus Colwellbacteria bacterium]|nr:terminase small subunit [Candidatus Colwellbacteria bacterium]